LRVPMAMRAFYERFLWITKSFSSRNPDLHHRLLSEDSIARLDKRAKYLRCFISNLLMNKVEEAGSTFFGSRRSVQKLNVLVSVEMLGYSPKIHRAPTHDVTLNKFL
jgi:hypothetical protein